MTSLDVLTTVRGIVTAYIADDLDMAGKLSWELAQHPQVAANALLELASLVSALVTDTAATAKVGTAAELWQDMVLVDMEKDPR
jgi:hypothetical protein